MTPNTLIERLRGLIRVPVNDGAGLLDGKDFFERSFPTSNLAREAAARIEQLEAALRKIALFADSADDMDDDPLDLAIGIARAALAPEQDK
jgi:hypothetical protein